MAAKPKFLLILSFFIFARMAGAQSCPKVVYTTSAATIKRMVTSVNCLVSRSANSASPSPAEAGPAAVQVESLAVVGPQHTRRYRKIVVAMLSISTGSEARTAVATPENPTASVEGTAGAECKVKINSDNTVDGQCNQTGGSLFVVYNN